jgi:hypothetical protein
MIDRCTGAQHASVARRPSQRRGCRCVTFSRRGAALWRGRLLAMATIQRSSRLISLAASSWSSRLVLCYGRRHGSPHHGSRTRISNCKVRPLPLPQGYPESAEIGRLLHHTDHRPNPREAIAGAYPSNTNAEGRHESHLGQARRRARHGTPMRRLCHLCGTDQAAAR